MCFFLKTGTKNLIGIYTKFVTRMQESPLITDTQREALKQQFQFIHDPQINSKKPVNILKLVDKVVIGPAKVKYKSTIDKRNGKLRGGSNKASQLPKQRLSKPTERDEEVKIILYYRYAFQINLKRC